MAGIRIQLDSGNVSPVTGEPLYGEFILTLDTAKTYYINSFKDDSGNDSGESNWVHTSIACIGGSGGDKNLVITRLQYSNSDTTQVGVENGWNNFGYAANLDTSDKAGAYTAMLQSNLEALIEKAIDQDIVVDYTEVLPYITSGQMDNADECRKNQKNISEGIKDRATQAKDQATDQGYSEFRFPTGGIAPVSISSDDIDAWANSVAGDVDCTPNTSKMWKTFSDAVEVPINAG